MKQFKHILSITLAIALLFSSVPMFSLSAAADTAALPGTFIKNGDFETGDLSYWNPGAATCFSASTEQVDTGTYSLKASGSTTKHLSQTIDVEKDTDYSICFRSYKSAGDNNGSVKVTNTGFTTTIGEKWVNGTNGSWQNNTLNFNSGDRTQVKVSVYLEKGTVYFDRIYIKKPNNLVIYGDFPVGVINNWNNLSGSDAIVSDGAPGENGYALLKTGSYNSDTRQSVAVSKNTDYILTFYSKGCNSNNGGQIKVMDGGWSNTFGQYSANGGASWTKKSVKFNSGNYNSVVLIIQATKGQVYFDNISLVEAVSATLSNDGNGTAESSDIVSNYLEKGSKATFTATPNAGYQFYGWYDAGDNLVSTDANYTFKVTAAVNLTAKFKTIDKAALLNPDFEDPDGAVNGNYSWTDVGFGTKEITDTQAHSGEKSLHLVNTTADHQYAHYTISSITPNTEYKVRFHAKINIDDGGSFIRFVTATKWSDTKVVTDANLSNCSDWTQFIATIPNTNTATTVYLGFYGKKCEVYIDDITVAKAVSVSVANGANGTATVKNQYGKDSFLYGDNAVYTATPAANCTFTGWYDGSENLVSTDASYTVVGITEAVSLTAQFEKPPVYKATIANCDFETGSGAFTNGNGWESITSGFAEITDTQAHSGNQSLLLTNDGSGYKHAYLKLTVDANRAYKLRFYCKSSANFQLQALHTSKYTESGGVVFLTSQKISSSIYWSAQTITIPANNIQETIWLDFFTNQNLEAYIDDITVAVEKTVSVDTNLSANKGYVRYANQYGKYNDSSSATYLYGDIVNLYAHPDFTCKLNGWKLSGASEYLSTAANYSFAITDNTDLVAYFGFDGLGDFDSNGTLAAADLDEMVTVLITNDDTQDEIADITEDGTVNLLDLVALKKRIAGTGSLYLFNNYGISGANGYIKQLKYVSDKTNLAGELIELSTHLNGISSSVNVFDSDDLNLTITLTNGVKTITVPGFYYKGYNSTNNILGTANGDSEFRFRFTLPEAGTWNFTATLSLDGSSVDTVSSSITAYENNANKGYIKTSGNRFAYEDDTIYTPIGQNIAYSSVSYNQRAKDIIDKMDSAADQGANFARVWVSPWSISLQKNGYAPNNLKGGMSDAVQFDNLFNAADELGVNIQLTLFTHNMFKSSGSNANELGWDDCTYNSANAGGVIATPGDFFTNATAKKQTKDYLRYMVARYGYSDNLFAWELINEADSTTGYNGSNVAAWYTEMTAYLKSIDPYGHMVTASATDANSTSAAYNSSFDFASLHLYYNEGSFVDDFISSRIANEANSGTYSGKPVMFGELGYTDTNGNLVVDSAKMHTQLWATLMSCGGAGASWRWDTIDTNNLYTNYYAVEKISKYIDFENTSFYNFNKSFGNKTNAFGYKGSTQAYFWIYGRNSGSISGASYTITGLTDGDYAVRWYDTVSGNHLGTNNLTASSGSLTINAPTFTNDIFVRVTPR